MEPVTTGLCVGGVLLLMTVVNAVKSAERDAAARRKAAKASAPVAEVKTLPQAKPETQPPPAAPQAAALARPEADAPEDWAGLPDAARVRQVQAGARPFTLMEPQPRRGRTTGVTYIAFSEIRVTRRRRP